MKKAKKSKYASKSVKVSKTVAPPPEAPKPRKIKVRLRQDIYVSKATQDQQEALAATIGTEWELLSPIDPSALSAEDREIYMHAFRDYYEANPDHPYHPKRRAKFEKAMFERYEQDAAEWEPGADDDDEEEGFNPVFERMLADIRLYTRRH